MSCVAAGPPGEEAPPPFLDRDHEAGGAPAVDRRGLDGGILPGPRAVYGSHDPNGDPFPRETGAWIPAHHLRFRDALADEPGPELERRHDPRARVFRERDGVPDFVA